MNETCRTTRLALFSVAVILGTRLGATGPGGEGAGTLNPCMDCEVGIVHCGETVDGEIAKGDCSLGPGVLLDSWRLEVPEPAEYIISVVSKVSAPSLRINRHKGDPPCSEVGSSETCAEPSLDACLSLWLDVGPHSILVLGGPFVGEVPAPYTLQVECVSPVLFVRGDTNQDGLVTQTDANYILGALFFSGPEAPSIDNCLDAADVNDDGLTDLHDALELLRYVYLEPDTAAPPPPFPFPGPDPKEPPDDLTCDSYDPRPLELSKGYRFAWSSEEYLSEGQTDVEILMTGQTAGPTGCFGSGFLVRKGLFKLDTLRVEPVALPPPEVPYWRGAVVDFNDPAYPDVSDNYDLLVLQANFQLKDPKVTLPALDQPTPVFRLLLDAADAFPADLSNRPVEVFVPPESLGVDPSTPKEHPVVSEITVEGGKSLGLPGKDRQRYVTTGVITGDFLFFAAGDYDQSGIVELGDAVGCLEWLYRSGTAPACLAEADINLDGEIDIEDPLFTLFYYFLATVELPTAHLGSCGWRTPYPFSCHSERKSCKEPAVSDP